MAPGSPEPIAARSRAARRSGGAEDPPRTPGAPRHLAPALLGGAPDRTAHEVAAVDRDPGHLGLPLAATAVQRAGELIGARRDERHAGGDLVARGWIAG